MAAAAADSDPAAAVAAMSTCAHWCVLASDFFPSLCPSRFPVPGSLVHARRRVGDALDLVDLDLSWGEPRFGRRRGGFLW